MEKRLQDLKLWKEMRAKQRKDTSAAKPPFLAGGIAAVRKCKADNYSSNKENVPHLDPNSTNHRNTEIYKKPSASYIGSVNSTSDVKSGSIPELHVTDELHDGIYFREQVVSDASPIAVADDVGFKERVVSDASPIAVTDDVIFKEQVVGDASPFTVTDDAGFEEIIGDALPIAVTPFHVVVETGSKIGPASSVCGTKIQTVKDSDLCQDNIGNSMSTLSTSDDVSDPVHDVTYFKQLLERETTTLLDAAALWETFNGSAADLCDDHRGLLLTVVGQARLLVTQRFGQFSGLINNCEHKLGELETRCNDLDGFWDMISVQVDNVHKKFKDLAALRENDWLVVQSRTVVKVIKKKVSAAKTAEVDGAKKAARKRLADIKRTMRQKVQEQKTFDGGFFSVNSPVREQPPHCTPKKQSSLLKLTMPLS